MSIEKEKDMPNRGRWSKEEKKLFDVMYQWHKNDWKKIAEGIKTRTIVQIRSHAQKMLRKSEGNVQRDLVVPKVYILSSAFQQLNEYVSKTSSNSYRKYIEDKQSLMYAQTTDDKVRIKFYSQTCKSDLIQ